MKSTAIFIALFSIIGIASAQVSLLDAIETKNHAVICVAYSANGTYYATSGYDQSIIIRNTKGEMVKRIQGHKSIVKAMVFSADGKFLIGGSDKKLVYVWAIETGTLTYALKGHSKEINCIAINQEGTIASGSADGIIKLWQLSSGSEFRSLENHEDAVNSLSFNGNGNQLVSVGDDNILNLWDAKTGSLLNTLKDTDKNATEIYTVAFAPDGKYIAAANSNNKIVFWNAQTAIKIKELNYSGSKAKVMKYSPDGRYLATGNSAGRFAIWNIETTTQVFESEAMSDATYSLDFEPAGNKLLTCNFTNAVYVWDISTLRIPEMLAEQKKSDEKDESGNTKLTPKIVLPKSDVDSNIPENCKNKRSNRYALIIGNEDYSSHQMGLSSEVNVDFAVNDAVAFAQYANKVFCIPDENIILLKNAKAVEMFRAIEKISLLSELANGKGEIIFYFAGHGFPDEITKEAYIMPVDVSGNDLRFAVNLKDLYEKLSLYPTQRVTVFLDACFSGGARNQGLLAARGVKIVPKNQSLLGNLVVFSASSGQESSLPYKDKEHGMFTYQLLKKIKDTKGQLTYGEMEEYIKVEVAKKSILINNKPQNPQVNISPTLGEDWKSWEF